MTRTDLHNLIKEWVNKNRPGSAKVLHRTSAMSDHKHSTMTRMVEPMLLIVHICSSSNIYILLAVKWCNPKHLCTNVVPRDYVLEHSARSQAEQKNTVQNRRLPAVRVYTCWQHCYVYFFKDFPPITNVYLFSLLAVCPGILWCVCVFVCLMYSSCDTWPQTDRVCLEGERVFDGWDWKQVTHD